MISEPSSHWRLKVPYWQGENLKPAGQEGAMEELADLLKAFLAGSAGKGSKGGPGVPQAKGAKAEPKKVKKRKDNPEWVK